MLDVGSGNVALKESARASVAQADRFLIAEAERGQHEGQHGEDLDTHGRSRRQRDADVEAAVRRQGVSGLGLTARSQRPEGC